MSANTTEKQRKHFWLLYLVLRKDRYKARITSDDALFHLSSTTGKIKKMFQEKVSPRYSSFAKGKLALRCYDVDGNILSRLRKTILCRTKDWNWCYQNKVLKHMIKESKLLYSQRNCFSPRFSTKSYRKIKYKMVERLKENMYLPRGKG